MPRLRVVLVALLAAVALLHCDLLTPAAHAQAHRVHADAAASDDSGQVSGYPYASDAFDSHCPAHAVHCVPQVVLPLRVGDLFDPAAPAMIVLAVAAAISLLGVAGDRTRGPPPAGPAAGGRRILTLLCIARR